QSVADIINERDAAAKHNEQEKLLKQILGDAEDVLNAAKAARAHTAGVIADLEARLTRAREELHEYNAKIPHLEKEVVTAKGNLEAFKPKGIDAINEKLANVANLNRQVRANAARDDA